ncbi:uncharacterized protein LOC143586223 [Bidens hawaiensis]|uniref:uncharacterized protein LOC143586223 n=1 Tax=Bidens hawaiensis TaxID=980011 RepID=UPI00404AB57C
MGACASVQHSQERGTLMITNGSPSIAMVIHAIDGRMQELRPPITTRNVLNDHQQGAFFLSSAETMFVDCHVPHVSADEHLQPGQIYFIMPVSMSYRPISLHEICLLAIKASIAIEKSLEVKKKMVKSKTTSFGGRRKGNGNNNQKVDFQVALKMLG